MTLKLNRKVPACAWALLLATGTAFADKKIAPDVPPSGEFDVIVQYKNIPSDGDLTDAKARGGVLKNQFVSAQAISLHVTGAAVGDIAANPNVAHVSPDRPVMRLLEFANPTVNANIALQFGFDGRGIGVAVIDSGVSQHEDLNATSDGKGASRIVYSQSFTGGDGTDKFGHGSHVAGIIAGNGSKSSDKGDVYTFRGIAPMVNIVNLQALDANGNGTDTSVIAAIEQAVALKSTYNIRVINLSLGRPVYESYVNDPLCKAVEYAWKNGIVVVVAAGNEGRNNTAGNNGYGTITAPGNDPWVITAGAMKDMGTVARGDDRLASYSSKGPTAIDHIVKPDIVAPGNHIIAASTKDGVIFKGPPSAPTTVANSYYQGKGGGISSDYFRLNGTSMAAPMVSGAAALLLQEDSTLTPDQVKTRLMLTATKSFPAYSTTTDSATGTTYTTQYDIFSVGAGYLDIWAALNNAAKAPGAALSPTALQDANGNIYLADTNSIHNTSGMFTVWGSTGSFSTFTVWGSSVLQSSAAPTSSLFTVWGSANILGSFTVWGSTFPGAGSTDNGTFTVWGSTTPSSQATITGTSVLTDGEN